MKKTAGIFLLLVFVAVCSGATSGPGDSSTTQHALQGLKFYFKLDPRITKASYMGDRWVSPPTFVQVGVPDSKTISMEARCEGLDAGGVPLKINPRWVPADPDMMTVMPVQGNQVTITVKRAGTSLLSVTYQEFSRNLSVTAIYKDNVIQVEIAQ